MRQYLTQHEVITAYERGWSKMSNGALLNVAEADGFDVLITTDSNLRHQQNLSSRRIAIVVLSTTSWPRIHRVVETVVQRLNETRPGSYNEVRVP